MRRGSRSDGVDGIDEMDKVGYFPSSQFGK